MDKEFMTIDEVAEMLSLHSRTIRRHIDAGKLKAIRVGGEWRIRRGDLEAFMSGTETARELSDAWTSQAVDFLEGRTVYPGKVRVCAIVDCDFADPAEAGRISTTLLDLINRRAPDAPKAKFQYAYDAGTGRGRFILWGNPAFIAQNMELLGEHKEDA
jgi:excisionase family DNA binding protein